MNKTFLKFTLGANGVWILIMIGEIVLTSFFGSDRLPKDNGALLLASGLGLTVLNAVNFRMPGPVKRED